LKNVPGRGKDVGVSTTESGCVSAVGPASIDYQETDMNNSEIGNGKRKRHPGQLPANKKQSIAISIADLFGDKR